MRTESLSGRRITIALGTMLNSADISGQYSIIRRFCGSFRDLTIIHAGDTYNTLGSYEAMLRISECQSPCPFMDLFLLCWDCLSCS